MLVQVLQAKICHAVITEADVNYKGSISIDEDLLDELGVLPWQVCDVNSGTFRGKTYIIPAERGSKKVTANGALAHHLSKGDIAHINIYCTMDYEEVEEHTPKIIESNNI